VAEHVVATLHPSSTGHRCRCGSCRPRIVVDARRSGLRPVELFARFRRGASSSLDVRRRARL